MMDKSWPDLYDESLKECNALRARVAELEGVLQREPRAGFPLGACHSCRLLKTLEAEAAHLRELLLEFSRWLDGAIADGMMPGPRLAEIGQRVHEEVGGRVQMVKSLK